MNDTVLDVLLWTGCLIGLMGVPILWYLHYRLSVDSDEMIEELRSELKDLDSRFAQMQQNLNVQALTLAAERTPHRRPEPPAPAASGPYRAPIAHPLPPVPFPDKGPDVNPPVAPQKRFANEAFFRVAAESLRSLPQFQSFTASIPCHFYTLPMGGVSTEPATTTDTASADIWAVEDGGDHLVFPGFGLRRMQSALVADAGRLARERVGWLFDIEAGSELGARIPARVKRGEWSVVHKGVLAVPL